MTSASDSTDHPIIVPPGEEDDEAARAQVIHASIIHDDDQDATDQDATDQDMTDRDATDQDEQADDTSPGGRPVTGADTASGDLPRRAWIPDRPVPGSRFSRPDAAQAVPAQRAPSEPETAEPELDEPELDEPELDGLATDEAEPTTDELAAGVPDIPEPARLETDQPVPATAADSRWPEIQSMFVDDPRQAVEQAAKLTSTALADLITAAKDIERTLASDWSSAGAGTEELRVALRGYRDLGARIATLTRDFNRG